VQFHAYRLPDGALVLDLQSDIVSHLPTRLVAPLVRERPDLQAMMILEPVLEVSGDRFALHAAEMAAVSARLVSGEPVASLVSEDYAIRRALDMLFSGF
jgi:toxin CcdB